MKRVELNPSKEEWKQVLGVFGSYSVSNFGRIKRIARFGKAERFLKATNAEVCLIDDNGKSIYVQLGRLILEAFVGPPPSSNSKARHLNDNRSDSSLQNLAWGSQKDNVQDAIRNKKLIPRTRDMMTVEELQKRSIKSQNQRHSEETKKKMSESGKRRMAARKDAGLNQPKPEGLTFQGRRHSQDFKDSASQRSKGNQICKGRIWITDGAKQCRIYPGQVIPVGWRIGWP